MELPDRQYATNARLPYQNDWTWYSIHSPKSIRKFLASDRERDAAFRALSTKAATKQAQRDKHLLFEAIVQHDQEACQQLISNTALLERHTSYGCQPLGLAAAVGDASIVSMFLEAGANIVAADGIGATALINAAYRGHTEVVKLLLGSKLGGPGGRAVMLRQCTLHGETALMAAAKGGHVEVLLVLLAAGADVHTCDSEGRNALMLACKRNKVDAVALLLGPSVGLSPEQRDLHGRTPLMHAAAGAALQVVQALLALQPAIDLSARDLRPPGHNLLPHHTINNSHSLSPSAAAARAAGQLSSLTPHSHSPTSPLQAQQQSVTYHLNRNSPASPSLRALGPPHHNTSCPRTNLKYRSTIIPQPPLSKPVSPCSLAAAAKEAATAQVDKGRQAAQEGKGGRVARGGPTKQEQLEFSKIKQQQQQQQQQQRQQQEGGGGWGNFEGLCTREVVWDGPQGLTALEHAAASTCAADARTLQILAEAGTQQLAALRAVAPQPCDATQDDSSGQPTAQPGQYLHGARGVPVAMSESMVMMAVGDRALGQQNAGQAEGQHGSFKQDELHGQYGNLVPDERQCRDQVQQLQAGPIDSRWKPQPEWRSTAQGRDLGGLGGAWGRGMVADPKDMEGGARLLWLAAEAGNLAAVEWLLKQGVGVQSLVDLNHVPPEQHPPPNAHKLLTWGSPSEGPNNFPHPGIAAAADAALSHRLPHPVFAAVQNGSEAVLDALIRAGARVDVRDTRGRTPTHWAAAHGHDAMVIALVARGASLTAMDLQGKVPRQLAYLNRRTSTAHLLTKMARQQLLMDSAQIEQEREIERHDVVVVPKY